MKSPVSVVRGHSQLTGPKLNSEAQGTMSSHLRLENGLSVPESGLVAPAGRPGPCPKRGVVPKTYSSRKETAPYIGQTRNSTTGTRPAWLPLRCCKLFTRETGAETDPPSEISGFCFSRGNAILSPGR